MARVDGTTSVSNNNFNSDNGTGLAVRTKLNQVLTALRTINAGTTDPVGVANLVQFQPHINNNVLKICTGVTGTDASATGSFTTIGNITQDNLGLLPVDGSNPMTGALQLPVGSETAPSLHFGQTNTGIFKGSSHRVSVTSAGTQVFYADSTGININSTKELRWKDSDNTNYIGFKAKNDIANNFTLTLPTTTGSPGQALVVASSGHSSTNAALEFATVASSGGGVVKNIVQTVKSTSEVIQCNNITTSGAFVDITGMSVNITPQDAGNKILVEFDLNIALSGFANMFINLVRTVGSTSTVLGLPNSPSGSGLANRRSTLNVAHPTASTSTRNNAGFKFLDTPNTTSQVTYKLTIGAESSSGTQSKAFINRTVLADADFTSSQIMVTEYDI